MMRKLPWLLVAAVAILSPGCAMEPKRVKAYHGPDLPIERLAVLEVSAGAIVEVDENRNYRCEQFECDFHLLPGEHSFTVSYEGPRHSTIPGYQTQYRFERPRVVSLTLEAGHTYTLTAWASNGNTDWWIAVTDDKYNGEGFFYSDRNEHCSSCAPLPASGAPRT